MRCRSVWLRSLQQAADRREVLEIFGDHVPIQEPHTILALKAQDEVQNAE